jgi:signal transduction histidine kinase
MRRKTLSLRTTLFIVIVTVAMVCVLGSAVFALILSSREVNKILQKQAAQQNTGVAPGQQNNPKQDQIPAGQQTTGQPQGQQPAGAQQGQQPPRQQQGTAQTPRTFPPWLWLVFVLSGLIGLALATGLSVWLSRRISKPISELTVTTADIADGDYGKEVHVTGGREIEELATAFNTLSVKLERNEELRKNMVADIAHELRTPLTTLRGDVEAVKDGLIEPEPAVLDNLLGDVIALTRLVDDLQQLSLADAGQLGLELASVAPGELVEEVRNRFANEYVGKGVSLDSTVEQGLPAIRADRYRAAQVLGNLVKNALAYTPAGGEVSISASQTGESVTMSVQDNGPGIPYDELPFIFERFCRLDRSRSRKTGGSGLGLTIARTIIVAHGGQIWADSEIGKGTRISFSLPIATADL